MQIEGHSVAFRSQRWVPFTLSPRWRSGLGVWSALPDSSLSSGNGGRRASNGRCLNGCLRAATRRAHRRGPAAELDAQLAWLERDVVRQLIEAPPVNIGDCGDPGLQA